MIKNYFKIAWRNLRKNRLYAFVNIIGLTVGIVSCLLIGIYIRHELSYDRFNPNADRMARVVMAYSFGGPTQTTAYTGTKVGPQFKRVLPQVVDYVRIFKRTRVINYQNQLFEEKNFIYADPAFFKMFAFNLTTGDAAAALNAPDKMVVSQTIAKKYFGDENPIGKVLKLADKNFRISGVAADAPSNSQVQFNFVVSFKVLDFANQPEEWFNANNFTYILFKDKDGLPSLQKQVNNYMTGVNKSELKSTSSNSLTYTLEPFTSVHLHSPVADGLEANGSITYIYILTVVAILILIIACVNYVNLAIAQSAGRGAEIGIRKVLGAAKQQLFKQFIGESVFVAAIAVLLAFGLAFIMLPFFNQLSGKDFGSTVLFDPAIIAFLLGLGVFIGFAAGAYPALVLAGAKLAKVLKSGFSFTSGQSVRRSLIIFQFVISIFLIVTTVVILQQLSYIRSKDIGYSKNNIIVLPVSYKMNPLVSGLKKDIAAIAGVEGVAAANNEPIDVGWGDAIKTAEGKGLTVNALPMDEDFIKTMKLKIIAGTDFNETDILQMDTTHQGKNYKYAFMLNETAAKALGWTPQQAIGQKISKNYPGTVKAVVKDFNFKSFHDPIGPLLIFLDHYQTQDIFIRVNGNNTASIITSLQTIWKSHVNDKPFSYKFLDEDYDAMYRAEQRTAGVFTTFSALAILLACLGLFAVTAYAVVQRTKEIGIRKVLGANISSIIVLISKDFLWLILMASVIASPIAWYMADKWLQDFAYRIDIQWWIFIAAGVASLIVAGVTVSFQALKAALANPVESLRSE